MDVSLASCLSCHGKLSPQEFMILPIGASIFHDALRMTAETYYQLGRVVQDRYGVSAKNVGDDGGYAPNIPFTSEALDCIITAIEHTDYSKEIFLAIDSAASSFYDQKMKPTLSMRKT